MLSSHRSGTILILIVVSLALITLLGGVYLQLARMDRESTRQTSGYITAVRDSVVQQIQTELLEDLLNTQTGKFFDIAEHIEPYDYPSNARSWGGTLGQFDDAWLASTTPSNLTGPNTGVWSKLTVLRRNPGAATPPYEYGYLTNWTWNYVTHDGAFTTTPGEVNLATHATLWDVNRPISEALLVDADGDGIPDSRWQWATLQQANNVQYVMAVRIIDNSSLINVNTATGLTSDGINTDSTANLRPRGYLSTDLDLTRLLSRTNLVAMPAGWPWQRNFFELLSARGDAYTGVYPGSITIPTLGLSSPGWDDSNWDISTPLGRGAAWLKRARIHEGVGKLLVYDPGIDEFELRYRGGLNSPAITPLENSMPTATRRDASAHTVYSDMVGDGNYHLWFQGSTDATDISARAFPEIRKMLTTTSGSAVLAYNFDWAPGTLAFDGTSTVPADPMDRRLKYDLVHQDGGATNNNTIRASNIAALLKAIFKTGDEATFTQYLGLNNADADILATEFALAIADYSDPDSIPTKATIGAVDYYGLEPLPFVREVYLQAAFTGADLWDGTGFYAANGSDGKSDTWTFQPGSDGFAVELGNPFDQTINLDHVQILLGGATFTVPAGTTIPAREHIVVYFNPVTDTDDGGTYTPGNLVASLSIGGTAEAASLTGGTLNLVTGSAITVELQVDVGGGTFVTYDRFTHGGLLLDGTGFHATTDAQQGTTATQGRHDQVAAHRACSRTGGIAKGIYYLSNINLTASGRTLPADTNYATGLTYFNTNAKGSPTLTEGEPKLDHIQLARPNRPFMSVAELGWVFMLGFTDEPAGDLPQRLDAILPLPDWEGRLFLDLSTTAKVPTGLAAGVPAIPHAAMVFDQFTTVSPAYDGLNNSDGTSGDPGVPAGWPANNQTRLEQFVPGTININTAPLHIATLAAALPEGLSEIQDLMAAIRDYRDRPKNSPADTYATRRQTLTGMPLSEAQNLRDRPGIAHLGELLFLQPTTTAIPLTSGAPSSQTVNMQRYGINTLDSTADAAVLLYPMPEEPSIDDPNLTDDAVQRMARFQYLTQNFTTRSDIYTAYILIHGYRHGDFTSPPTERGRWIVVFDRSNVTRKEDSPRVLGVYKVN